MRAVAVMEAVKGFLVFAAGFGLLTLLHRDVGQVAIDLVTRLHIDPDAHYAGVFVAAANKVGDAHLWGLAAFALLYSIVRLAEGYGLWHGRRWAAWLGAASGAIYLPVEFYELWHHRCWLKVATVLLNLAVVGYLVWTLRQPVAPA